MELAYASGLCDQPLLGETIGANLERTAVRSGDREALVSRHQGKRYTYRELDREVDRLARGLLALGLEKGDRAASGARTARSGCCSSTRRRRRGSCSSTSTPRTAPRSSGSRSGSPAAAP